MEPQSCSRDTLKVLAVHQELTWDPRPVSGNSGSAPGTYTELQTCPWDPWQVLILPQRTLKTLLLFPRTENPGLGR